MAPLDERLQAESASAPRFEAALRRASHLGFRARRREERALALRFDRHLALLQRLALDQDLAVRRTVVELLRLNARRSPRVRKSLLRRLEAESDIKTRRRICVALGESGDDALRGPLLEALAREEHRYVQVSLILALGKLGLADWPARWRRVLERGPDGPVRDALRRAARTRPDRGREPDRPTGRFLLHVYPGMEHLAALECSRFALAALIVSAGWLSVEVRASSEVRSMGRLRAILSDLAVLAERPLPADLEQLILDSRSVLRSLPVGQLETPSFRLSLPRQKSRSAYRSAVRQLCGRLEEITGWQNDPSAYEIDLRVERIGDHAVLLCRDRAWTSARTGRARISHPASIPPSVAAGLCHAALRELRLEHGPRLLDPCCGSGTILEEWLSISPDASAVGADVSRDALRMSHANLLQFRDRVALLQGDLRRLPLPAQSVDAVIANLPFGIRARVRTPRWLLYRGFLAEALRVLRPEGVLLAYLADRMSMDRALGTFGITNAKPLASIARDGGLTVTAFLVRPGQPSR